MKIKLATRENKNCIEHLGCCSKEYSVEVGVTGTYLLELIKAQTNLDLTRLVHEQQPKPTKYLAVDLKADFYNPSREIRQLQALESKGYFRIESNGGLGIALIYGPKLLEWVKRSERVNMREKKT